MAAAAAVSVCAVALNKFRRLRKHQSVTLDKQKDNCSIAFRPNKTFHHIERVAVTCHRKHILLVILDL